MDTHDIAHYLANNPDFFEEHTELLSKIKLTSPLTGRAVSLQERQMEVLRDKIKILEMRIADLIRLATDNYSITHKFEAWVRAILLVRNDVDLPHVLITQLQNIFAIPQVTLRIWSIPEHFSHTWFAQTVSEDIRLFTNSLTVPFCGENKDFEAVQWLSEPGIVKSIALLPLRVKETNDAFGLLVFGSDDALRFTSEMNTDFLMDIASTASAALTFLCD